MENEQPSHNHDIHSALKTCEEIKEAMNLYSWLTKIMIYREQQREFPEIQEFAKAVIVAIGKDYDEKDLQVIARKEVFVAGTMMELVEKCIIELLSSGEITDKQKLQCFGFQLKGGKLAKETMLTALSTQKQYFFQDEWNHIRTVIGNELFRHLYTKYMLFQRTAEGTLVQFCGNNVFDYLKVNDKFDKKFKPADQSECRKWSTWKYNVKDDKDHYLNNINVPNWNNMKSRTRIFYCTQFNRNNQFFKKHELINNKNNVASGVRAQAIFNNIFRFNRIRKKLKDINIKPSTIYSNIK